MGTKTRAAEAIASITLTIAFVPLKIYYSHLDMLDLDCPLSMTNYLVQKST